MRAQKAFNLIFCLLLLVSYFVAASPALLAGSLSLALLYGTATVTASSSQADTLMSEARKHLDNSEIDFALQKMEAAVQSDTKNYVTRFKRAISLISLGRNSHALSDLDAVLELKPDFDQVSLLVFHIFLFHI